jgi:hypothetical protein
MDSTYKILVQLQIVFSQGPTGTAVTGLYLSISLTIRVATLSTLL